MVQVDKIEKNLLYQTQNDKNKISFTKYRLW
jgi:hypothetical protein